MLTLFSIPKPFRGPIRTIQRNALQSWLALQPPCEVILFGDDEGVAETAAAFAVRHIPGTATNDRGTPLLDAAFTTAQQEARHETLVYVNADIILLPALIDAVGQVTKTPYLMSGRRWDLDVDEAIDFQSARWQEDLLLRLGREGHLHGPSGIDYFVFPRDLPHGMPPFAVGRPGWDNWLIFAMRSKKIPVIDATATITVIHQNHPSVYRIQDAESQQNCRLAGGLTRMLSLRDADWVLTGGGLRRPHPARRAYGLLAASAPWRALLGLKRRLQQRWLS